MKLTKEQAIVITSFTGVAAVESFADFHSDLERRIGRPVWTHEMANEEFSEKIKELYREDFINMCQGVE